MVDTDTLCSSRSEALLFNIRGGWSSPLYPAYPRNRSLWATGIWIETIILRRARDAVWSLYCCTGTWQCKINPQKIANWYFLELRTLTFKVCGCLPELFDKTTVKAEVPLPWQLKRNKCSIIDRYFQSTTVAAIEPMQVQPFKFASNFQLSQVIIKFV